MSTSNPLEINVPETIEKIFSAINNLSQRFVKVETKQGNLERILILGNGEKAIVAQVRDNREEVSNINRSLEDHTTDIGNIVAKTDKIERIVDRRQFIDSSDVKWKKRFVSFGKWLLQTLFTIAGLVVAIAALKIKVG